VLNVVNSIVSLYLLLPLSQAPTAMADNSAGKRKDAPSSEFTGSVPRKKKPTPGSAAGSSLAPPPSQNSSGRDQATRNGAQKQQAQPRSASLIGQLGSPPPASVPQHRAGNRGNDHFRNSHTSSGASAAAPTTIPKSLHDGKKLVKATRDPPPKDPEGGYLTKYCPKVFCTVLSTEKDNPFEPSRGR
jgi:hypothetical protein